jgi:hypothetical protein
VIVPESFNFEFLFNLESIVGMLCEYSVIAARLENPVSLFRALIQSDSQMRDEFGSTFADAFNGLFCDNSFADEARQSWSNFLEKLEARMLIVKHWMQIFLVANSYTFCAFFLHRAASPV